jgi:hypothetical protein
MPITTLEFDIGKTSGSCSVYYEPAEYEGIYLFCSEFVEFDNVDIKGRKISFKDINTTLHKHLLKAWEEKKLDRV